MLFCSLVFLWFFLPIVFFICTGLKKISRKNAFLLAASIVFYTWGEPVYIILLLISIIMNYAFGFLAARKKSFAVVAVICNLALLGYFKYFNFAADILCAVFGREILPIRSIALPIGISFYTFQALSYVIDVSRGTIRPQKNFLNLALYISFFPQLIAGPIVKYHDIETQLTDRTTDINGIAAGIRRFVFGLSKKVILANTFAAVVDRALSEEFCMNLSRPMIFVTILLYTLQIYFDFSGYSDMAIGLGRMFGFRFPENFNLPYMSRSVSEFWRRWHISLSSWFREYVYIPLGGNRKGLLRTCVNLFIVFFLTGLWHGAAVNFVLWGIYYAFFLILERVFLGKLLDRLDSVHLGFLRRIYTLAVVAFGWVLFRADTFDLLKGLIKGLLGMTDAVYLTGVFMDARVWFFVIIGVFLCGPHKVLEEKLSLTPSDPDRIRFTDLIVVVFLLVICIMLLVNNTYNPFIYFRF